MCEQYIFDCKVTNYFIEYIVDGEKGILNTIVSDYQHIKPLVSLIRSSIEQLKKIHVTIIAQYVSFEEWNQYLKDKTTWQIVIHDNKTNIYMIECPINDFLENYGIGIGL